MIRDYHSFTMARSEGRVPMLSTPEASRIRQKQFQNCFQGLDDEEKSRTWRGFLTYDLLCLMHGVPSMAAAARGEYYRIPKEELFSARELFRCIPTYMQEEVLCVRQYFEEQYDLAFNTLKESFELAVGELGRRASGTSPSSSTHVQPITEQPRAGESTVQHLFDPPYIDFNSWNSELAWLGVNFLQSFLSWDSSTRLDFIRITCPFFSSRRLSIRNFLRPGLRIDRLMEENFGWPGKCMDQSKLADLGSLCPERLRAVGWIFWKQQTPRPFTTNSDQRSLYRKYNFGSGAIRRHVRLQVRPQLAETPVEEQEWERIVQHYAPSFSERQLNDIKSLFESIGNFDSGCIADIVSAMRCQDEDVEPTEVTEGGN